MNAVKLAKSTVPENYASAKVASILLNYDAISFKKLDHCLIYMYNYFCFYCVSPDR